MIIFTGYYDAQAMGEGRRLRDVFFKEYQQNFNKELRCWGITGPAYHFIDELAHKINVPDLKSDSWLLQRECFERLDDQPIMFDLVFSYIKQIGCIIDLYKGHLEEPLHIWRQEKKESIDLCAQSTTKYHRAIFACALLLLKQNLPTMKKIGFGYASMQSDTQDKPVEDMIKLFIEKQVQEQYMSMPENMLFSFQDPIVQAIINKSFQDFGLLYNPHDTSYCGII